MNGLNYIDLGEKIIDVVNKEKQRTLPRVAAGRYNRITKMTLDKDYLINFTKNDNFMRENELTFGHYLYDLYDWTLEITHKIKSNFEIVFMSLKKDGQEVIKGAFSKTKTEKGEVKKFHFADNDLILQTGHTNRLGKLLQAKKTNVVPEKYKDYFWILPDTVLHIVSDAYGIFGKQKSVEAICEEWNLKPYKVKRVRIHSIQDLQKQIQEGLPAIKETKTNHYTIEDYFNALNYLREDPVYNHVKGNDDSVQIIDNDFIERFKKVRKYMDIVKEWRENIEFFEKK